MDEIALRKALATLRSFKDNFPKGGTIEEKYIAYYHQLLDDIARETSHDLDYSESLTVNFTNAKRVALAT